MKYTTFAPALAGAALLAAAKRITETDNALIDRMQTALSLKK